MAAGELHPAALQRAAFITPPSLVTMLLPVLSSRLTASRQSILSSRPQKGGDSKKKSAALHWRPPRRCAVGVGLVTVLGLGLGGVGSPTGTAVAAVRRPAAARRPPPAAGCGSFARPARPPSAAASERGRRAPGRVGAGVRVGRAGVRVRVRVRRAGVRVRVRVRRAGVRVRVRVRRAGVKG